MSEEFKSLTPSNIDEYLCHNRYLKLELHIGTNTVISLIPYKTDFLVTWIDDQFEIREQYRELDWTAAFTKFNEICNSAFNSLNDQYRKES